MRAVITPVFWSDRGEHHNDHGTDMTRKPNRLRSPQQSRRHGPLLEKVGYIRSIFSITPEPHIGSIDMNESHQSGWPILVMTTGTKNVEFKDAEGAQPPDCWAPSICFL